MEILPGSLLSQVNNPADLKKLPREQLHQLCDELRQYIIDVVSVHGGHFGASLGVVELTVAIHYVFNAPYDQILIDGSVEYIPDAIVDQLADGGRLGAAVSDRGMTRLVIGRKAGDAFGTLSIGDSGVPALPGFSRPEAFTF